MTGPRRWFVVGSVAGAAALAYLLSRASLQWAAAPTWQRLASPGDLSSAHASLEEDCAACHAPIRGVDAAGCIACHANEAALLQRQPTAFHADVTSCAECHLEHQGRDRRPTAMRHEALANIGLRQLEDPETRPFRADLLDWIAARRERVAGELSPEEAALRCVACHANEDRHVGLFGEDCTDCHATSTWAIASFRHPSPRSLDCAQCHQAPPSHYMEHFRMVSQRVAGRPEARVEQCFLCHQTTAWPDIKGVGWYKHH